MPDSPDDLEPDAGTPPDDAPLVDPSVFDNLVLDDDFIRGGSYEPPARTRAAIAKHGNDRTSWRHGGGLNQPPSSRATRKNKPADANVVPLRRPKKSSRLGRFARRPRSNNASGRRERFIAWLPAIAAIAAVTLVVAFGNHHGL